MLLCISGFSIHAQSDNWIGRVNYLNSPGGFVLGYTNSQFRYHSSEGSTYGSYKGRDNFLHGGYAGFVFEINCFRGLGFYLGSIVEYSYDPNGTYQTSEGEYTDYKEFRLYFPLHLHLKLPLNEHNAIGLHSGVGFTPVVYSAFTDSKGYLKALDAYGEYGMAKTNITFDWGVYYQIRKVRISAAWRYGIANLKDIVYGNEFCAGLDFMF